MNWKGAHILVLGAALSAAAQPAQPNAFAEAVQAAREGQAAQAVRMFRTLAQDRNGEAQYNLAVLYARGTGVPQSAEMALYWAWRARFSGVKKAKMLTSYLMRGATPDLMKKVQKRLSEDLIQSINDGHKEAMLALGRVYLELTDPADPELALVWFTIAAALQQPHASTWRDVVARKLDQEQRLTAQERAANLYQQWCDGHGLDHPDLCSYNS
ncbi:tetratricopeptide repeat protein [Thalassovita aquimarina]|uniref:Sel1 repeat family protein n=1 Tax=Thalassovita aquimarina TaxID=2785917 RepID=A0ABS5HLE7_9RHOB|nr:SEL1-like repeat protein [Thalassovita aquimarina]MBR9649646.1 sel1 repeat family protein [Thalassovita aquimarina]